MRKASLFEPLVVFALIMAYIWRWRVTHPWSWALPAALIVASHIAHHESAASLGFRTANFADCVRKFGPALIGLVLAMAGAGLLFGTVRPIGLEPAIESLALYLPWGLIQQYLLNGYFLNRFDMALSRNAASILASALFCVAHSPNWPLMLITAGAAYAAICIYRRYRNLYFLGLAHATIGFLLFMLVPDSLIHHMRVGPGWFTWR
jgi:membrane protease YdiL (CAAX protease family)